MDDPYLPPATELREELPPRRYAHVLLGAVLAYATSSALMLALGSSLDMRNQAYAGGSALLVGIAMAQFRQLPWKLVALIAPPAALVALLALAYGMELFF